MAIAVKFVPAGGERVVHALAAGMRSLKKIMTNTETPATETGRFSEQPRPLIPIWWWVVVTFGVVASLIVGPFDRATSYIVLFVTFVVGISIVLIRYLRQSRLPLLGVLLLLASGPVLLALLAMLIRVDDVTGNLVPTKLSFRWQPRRDEMLKLPAPAPQAVMGIDLTATTENDFPQFLGPHRNGSVNGISLATDWKAQPPELIWQKSEFGAGWSAFAAVNGYAVTLEQRGEDELTSCYKIETGEPVWSQAIQTRHQTVPGGVGPRSTPTIFNGRVYALGATGILRCLNGSDGAEVWRRDLLAEIGTTPEEDLHNVAWGRAASPLLDAGRVIVPLGQAGDDQDGATLAAFDALSGELLWRQGNRQVSYASPMIAVLDGMRQIVMVCQDFVCGHDAETGEPLWEYPWPGRSNANASCSQPIDAGESRLFFSKGYALGAALVKVIHDADGSWRVDELWRIRTVMKAKFNNPVIYEGHVYGLDDGILSCVELETGQRKWKRGRYGHGQVLRVGDVLLVQAESGVVHLVALDPTAHNELTKFRAISGKTWNNPCLYGKYLLVRNAEQAACYQLP